MIVQPPPHSTHNNNNSMSSTTTTIQNDDIITLSYAEIISETVPHNPELQLSIQDLVNPTETAESLLETLSNEQLSIIEKAVNKIKERKLGNVGTKDINDQKNQVSSTEAQGSDPWNTSLVAKVLAEVIANQDEHQQKDATVPAISKPVTPSPAGPITDKTAKDKPPTPPPQRNDTKPNTSKPPINTTTATGAASTTPSTSPFLSSHEPTTELKEGVEWVSFVYSHHRTLRRYCIRTDLDKVDTNILDDKFKKENCVYPRANLPRETYRGNRWSYETECNVLGWKLAYLNPEEIAGKRGLIQRAVDSYRNRYPSMRSRRVARQEKLLKGTLRKRKHREVTNSEEDNDANPNSKSSKNSHEYTATEKTPKTILIEDIGSSSKCRIRINIESVVLDAVDMAFRKNNCVFPRALNITSDTPSVSQRRLDEAKCNEIGWKLAWLNPRQLANKKNLLQRALDTYRNQFTPNLKPRKYASRVAPAPYVHPPPAPPPSTSSPAPTTDANVEIKQEPSEEKIKTDNTQVIPLTEQALADQQKELMELGLSSSSTSLRRDSATGQSCYSGTTVTLDFHDYCFSPPPGEDVDMLGSCEEDTTTTTTTTMHDLSTAANSPALFPSAAASMFDELILASLPSLTTADGLLSGSSSNNSSGDEKSYQNTPSPQALITLSEIYQQALLMSATANNSAAVNDDNLLFHNINTDTNTKDNNDLFLLTGDGQHNSSVIDLIAKFGSVTAGMDNLSSTTCSTDDSSLLNQLF